MNNTLIKDFILDCLQTNDNTVDRLYILGLISEERYNSFEDSMSRAKNFIRGLEDDKEDIRDEKTDLYVKGIMKKFDEVVENFKEK